MNSADILVLAKGTSPPSVTMVREQSHPGERQQSVTDGQTDGQTWSIYRAARR